jgi:hypothetical protein
LSSRYANSSSLWLRPLARPERYLPESPAVASFPEPSPQLEKAPFCVQDDLSGSGYIRGRRTEHDLGR